MTIHSSVPGRKGKRRPKYKPTAKAVEKYNQKIAAEHLSILMNSNFEDGDYHLTLTYKSEPSPEEAEKILKRFLARLRNMYKKAGITLKWILVTEYAGKRIHHHIVVNRYPEIAKVKAQWKEGHVFQVALYSKGDYRDLAEYFIKESSRHFRDADSVSKQRFRHSKSVRYPETMSKEVSTKELYADPKANRGYAIDEDSLYIGENPFTGSRFVKYVEIACEEPKNLRQGKKRKYKAEYYSVTEEEHQYTISELGDKQEGGESIV